MKKIIKLAKSNFVFLILVIGFLIRTHNLNWGAPYYFHPDERNIASLLSQDPLYDFPSYLSKGTFSYGNSLTNIFQIPKILITNAKPDVDLFILSTLITRYASAFFAISTLFVLYKTGCIFSRKTGAIAIILGTFSTGLIQNSRFGTFDTFITFSIFLSFYFSLLLVKTSKLKYLYYACLAIILAASAKITSLTFLPIILLSFLIVAKGKSKKRLLYTIPLILIFAIIPILSPYYATKDFSNLLQYERGVVTGSLPVFYTQSFHNTIPIVFQFTDIYPFLINPLIVFLFLISFISCVIFYIRKRDKKILITLIAFLILFIPQSILFAKWSRYMLPTLPFIYLIVAIFFSTMLSIKNRLYNKALNILLVLTIIISALHSLSYLLITSESSQISAFEWSKNNIPNQSSIVSEQYDLGILPFNQFFTRITLYDFYGAEDSITAKRDISSFLDNAEYIILPSQRILKSRLNNKSLFPIGNKFYSSLYFESGDFRKVYETECDFICKFVYFGNPIQRSEETTSVFDRPIVTIYKRIR